MSADVADLTAEVPKSGNSLLLRKVYLGDAKHVIKHSWRLHTLGVALTTTLLVNSKSHRAKNRIRKVHVRLIGEHEIYRLGLKLAGIEGTREVYHFMGASNSKNNAATTTDGLQDDVELMLKRERGGRLPHREKERLTKLGEVKVMTERGGWKEDDAEKPISGEEEVVVRKVKRRYYVRTRLSSYFYSQCQISRYEECHINRTYLALVPALIDGEVKETVIMDTGAFPVGVDEAQQIKFRPRANECRMSRVTGI